MNTLFKLLSISLIFASAICTVRAEDAKAYVPETKASSEVFQTRVLKVYHITEGDLEFLSYVIEWRGHEVVVIPRSAKEIYKEGDTVRCMMRAAPAKITDGQKVPVTFSIFPSKTSAEEAARIQAVTDAVNPRPAKKY